MPHPPHHPRWPWLLLALALIWTGLLRLPLIINAEDHLDSDLAVDGLTLLEATAGHWRWHYPGTPIIGSPAVLLSYVQAKILGATPQTLVSGGTVAACLLMIFSFLLIFRAFGPRLAAWSLIPSTFASAGTVWLAGRITGGHLLVTAWHAAALWLVVGCWQHGGKRRAFFLGIWCGFGLYVDSMMAISIISILIPSLLLWIVHGRSRVGVFALLLATLGFMIGDLPRELGRYLDSHDAYQGQFDPILEPDVLLGHARILFGECLPRLIGGHTFPHFASEPLVMKLPGRVASLAESTRFDPLAAATTIYALTLFSIGLGLIARKSIAWKDDPIRAALSLSVLLCTGAILVTFIINRNIFTSDNFRYLVFLLIPWSLGFGLMMQGLWARGRSGRLIATMIALSFSVFMTLDVARYYHTYEWINAVGLPIERATTDPAIGYFRAHPEATRIYGDYWDVYRLSFLTGGRLLPRPLGIYPDRFPEWKARDGASDVYLVARGGRVPSAGWTDPVVLRGLKIVRWPWSKPPQNRQPWD